jgi:hypothetical protein
MGASRLFFPVQSAFSERVNVADHQGRDEAKHAPQDEAALPNRLFINDRPRVHEHDFQIEEDEEHGHEIKPYAEPRLSAALRHHAAFIRAVFRPGPFAGFSQRDAHEQSGDGKTCRHDYLQENRQVFSQHSRLPEIGAPLVDYLTLAARWPFCGAIACASAEGRPLYFLPFFLTAPRATRFCSFS